MSNAGALFERARAFVTVRAPDDPVAFARLVGVQPDPWQERVLRCKRNILLCCTRQAGKSTVASILVSHRAMTRPRHLALLISPSLRQSKELFRKVKGILRAAGAELVTDNATDTELTNGSRIISLPASGETIRGFSAVDTLVEDESGYVEDELLMAVRPMLAVSRGQHFELSSPNGKSGHFYEHWENGGDAWERERVTCWEIPRMDRAFLEAERRAMGEMFRQEYEAEFIDAAGGRVYAFDAERNVIPKLPAPITDKRWTWLLAFDFGIVADNAVAVIGWLPHDPTAYIAEAYRFSGEPTVAAEEAKALQESYRFSKIVGDVGGLGKGFEAELVRRHHIPIEPAEKQNKLGYIRLMNSALVERRIRVVGDKCGDLIEEWRTLPRGEDGKEAKGFVNHAADAALYGWRASHAFLAKPAPPPKPGRASEEANAAAEKRLEDELEAELRGDRRGRRSRKWLRKIAG